MVEHRGAVQQQMERSPVYSKEIVGFQNDKLIK